MTRPLTVAAIVLAAGRSRRMGAFKPLMTMGGRTVIDRVIDSYSDAGIADVRVVVGHRAGQIEDALRGRLVTVVRNPHYAHGMFTSVQCGIASLPATVDAFFVHPVDIPLVRPHTIRRLLADAAASGATVTCPVFGGRRGHPPLIRRRAAAAVLAHTGGGGLRRVLQRLADDTHRSAVADQGILLDIDTPADAAAMQARLGHAHCLSDVEVRVFMDHVLHLPASVITHGRQVARVAEAIADAVRQSGTPVDGALIRCAALVHDAAKGRPDHAAAGAAWLIDMGFADVAAVVAAHTDITVAENQPVDEAQIVHLADKLVDGDAIVDLDRRFAAALSRYGGDPAAVHAISQRRQAARRILDKVQRTTGRALEDLIGQAARSDRDQACNHS